MGKKVFPVPKLIVSSTPSNTIDPPFVLENPGLFINVPLLLLLLKSVQIVPLPGYDLVFAASRLSTRPFVITFGPPVTVPITLLDLENNKDDN
jgi:hypothetical protein